jgi:hypothetical protein
VIENSGGIPFILPKFVEVEGEITDTFTAKGIFVSFTLLKKVFNIT